MSYLVETGGQVKRKHADQLRTKIASEQGMLEELMHDNPARVINGRQGLDVDAIHSETQGTKRGDEGSYQVLHRSPQGLLETAGGCQKPHTEQDKQQDSVSASNERVQENQTRETNTVNSSRQEGPTLPAGSSRSVH